MGVAPQDGKGERKHFKPGGAGFYERPEWAPDSRKISFIDNSFSVYFIDLERGATKKIASEYMYSPIKTLTTAWSPDSKWLAYTLNTPSYIQTVHVYSIDQGKSFPITDSLSEVSEPVFDKSGNRAEPRDLVARQRMGRRERRRAARHRGRADAGGRDRRP